MASITVLTANFSCVKQLSGGAGAGGNSEPTIRAAVGAGVPPRVRNYPDDVAKIQTALNRFTPLAGGPLPPLVIDGLCGPKTRAAIHHFQKKWDLLPKGWKVPDGIVDPDGQTIRRLRTGAGAPTNLPADFMARIPRVIGVLTATRAALTLARTFLQRGSGAGSAGLPSLASVGEAEAGKVDRHFHVRKLANPLRRVGEIERMYLNMLTAIGYVPQGVVVAADEPPNLAVGAFMFTFAGGYHQRKLSDTYEGIQVASIYLCPKSRTLGPDAFTYAMIHELAHYTGPTSDGVTDHAYFHRNPAAYRALTPYLAFRNADSYSQLAFDLIGKTDFNIERHRH